MVVIQDVPAYLLFYIRGHIHVRYQSDTFCGCYMIHRISATTHSQSTTASLLQSAVTLISASQRKSNTVVAKGFPSPRV